MPYLHNKTLYNREINTREANGGVYRAFGKRGKKPIIVLNAERKGLENGATVYHKGRVVEVDNLAEVWADDSALAELFSVYEA
jgi:hypothetical protein